MTFIFLLPFLNMFSQITERERPEEWDNLVNGGRFMDRFLPIPPMGPLSSDTWGGNNVIPRYVENGLEDMLWSYWGGNALIGPDGKYHLFVCRWREDSRKGHMEWPRSLVVHAVSAHPLGPYQVKESIGKGHNPEIFQLQDVQESGSDLILVFEGKGNGLSKGNFTAKLLGKDKEGKLLFGYARLPWVEYPDAPATVFPATGQGQ